MPLKAVARLANHESPAMVASGVLTCETRDWAESYPASYSPQGIEAPAISAVVEAHGKAYTPSELEAPTSGNVGCCCENKVNERCVSGLLCLMH